jgi:hypothetical protein
MLWPVLFPRTGSSAVVKDQIPKKLLEHLALIKMRAHSGCKT